MGVSISPTLRRELANLDKDAESRKSAMKTLKSYVKDLDSKNIPVFLSQVSETNETGSVPVEFTISLYEVLARVHGVKIVPLTDSIMGSIIQTLASSAGSFPLHQACSKVVPAIARYGIDSSTPEDKKTSIIHSLCKPLSDSLLGPQESLTSGAALCLKALVDSDNWRFASDEMVNKVCQNVAVALEEKSSQTNVHIGLVMALAKRNALVVDAYARLLLQSGLGILNAGQVEGNSQKRLSAIQMVNFLMKWLDPRCIYSELDIIMEEMEKCQSDKMAYVRGAAFEALQTAKKISMEKGSRYEKGPDSATVSNFSRRGNGGRRNLSCNGDQVPASISQHAKTLYFCDGNESLVESPISRRPVFHNSMYDSRSVNRKHWNCDNGRLDYSLRDCLSLEITRENDQHAHNYGYYNNEEDITKEFQDSSHRNHTHRVSRSTNSTPLRSRMQASFDNIQIFSTPRKLIHSLQDPSSVSPVTEFSEKLNRKHIRSLSATNAEWSPASELDQTGCSPDLNYDGKEDNNLLADDGEHHFQDSESVASTDDAPIEVLEQEIPPQVVLQNRTENQNICTDKRHRKGKLKFFCGLSIVLLAAFTPLLWINNQDGGYYLVPT